MSSAVGDGSEAVWGYGGMGEGQDDSWLGGNSLCVCLEVAGIVVVCSRRSRSQSLLLGWQAPGTRHQALGRRQQEAGAAHVYPPPCHLIGLLVLGGYCLLQ